MVFVPTLLFRAALRSRLFCFPKFSAGPTEVQPHPMMHALARALPRRVSVLLAYAARCSCHRGFDIGLPCRCLPPDMASLCGCVLRSEADRADSELVRAAGSQWAVQQTELGGEAEQRCGGLSFR